MKNNKDTLPLNDVCAKTPVSGPIDCTCLVYVYTCGGCEEKFRSVNNLHDHVLGHNNGGTYKYIHSIRTAFPIFNVCASTQTFLEEELSHDNKQTLYSCSVKVEYLDDTILQNTNKKDIHENDTDSCDRNSVVSQTQSLLVEEASKNIEQSFDECIVKIEYVDDTVPQDNIDIVNCLEENGYKLTDKDNKNISDSDTDGYDVNSVIQESCRKVEIKPKPKERPRSKPRKVKKDIIKKRYIKKYNCSNCDKEFSSKLRYNYHMRKVHGDMKVHECSWCGDRFKMRKSLTEHLKHCAKNDSYKCFICDTKYTTRDEINQHLLFIHRNTADLKCKLCDRQCTDQFLMQSHMKRHKLPRDIKCERCGMSFYDKKLLRKHFHSCTDEKLFQCSQCELSFKTKRLLTYHSTVHKDDRPFICHICGYATKKNTYLNTHIRRHIGEKNYGCQECGMRFSTHHSLHSHKKVHTKVRSSVCKFCGKAFGRSWTLKIHERQHTGETPYECEYCGQAFKQKVLVNLHLKSHHPHMEAIKAGIASGAATPNKTNSSRV